MTEKELIIDGKKVDVVMKLYNTCTLPELQMIERLVRNMRHDEKVRVPSKS